uniref:Uncharacterized protein n=1 Tax=Anopheles melas TaxID=34690 RepID=A0A182UJQ3_9DIPT
MTQVHHGVISLDRNRVAQVTHNCERVLYRLCHTLFYDLQRSFSTVVNNPSLEIQTILGHVTKSTHKLTKYYCSIVSFNGAAYGLFPMLFIVVKYAVTGSYDVPLSTPIEGK